jgi:hypothetical protein
MSQHRPTCSSDAIIYEPHGDSTEGTEEHGRTPLDVAYFQAAEEFQNLAEQTSIPALKARYLRLARSFRHLALIVSPREGPAAPPALGTDAVS